MMSQIKLPSILLLVAFIVALFWPMKTRLRHLSPSDFIESMDGSSVEAVNLSKDPELNIVIGVASEIFDQPFLMDDLESLDVAQWSKNANEMKGARPYLFPSRVGINMATYARKNKCSVTLVLSLDQKSAPIECENLIDNDVAFFEFNNPVRPGKYTAHMDWKASGPGNEVAVYTFKDKQGALWVDAFTQFGEVSFLKIMFHWVQNQAFLASSYLIAAVLLLILLLVDIKFKYRMITLLIVLLLGTMLISRPFSGHDETAHVKMLQKAIDSGKEADIDLNKTAHALMVVGDFFRMHEVRWIRNDTCPHMILMSCGVSNRPLYLYSYYAPVLQFLGVRANEASDLIVAARLINLFLLFSFIVLQVLLLGVGVLPILATMLIFYGGFQSQFASISNDPPMYLLGLQASMVIYGSLVSGFGVRLLALYLVFSLQVWFCLGVDISGLSILPLLAIMPILWLFRPTKAKVEKSVAQYGAYRSTVLFIGSITFLLFAARFFWEVIVHQLLQWPYFNAYSSLLDNLLKFNFMSAASALYEYFMSIMGTYIWGHSYYHKSIYLMAFAGMFFLVYKAMQFIGERYSGRKLLALIFILSSFVAIQLLFVLLAVEPSLASHPITLASFLKVRLTAPAAGAIAAIISLGLSQITIQKRSQERLFAVSWLWVLLLLICYLPKFHWADAY